MKKDIFITIIVFFVGFMGYSFCIMQIYSSPDGNSYPFNASLIYLGTATFIFVFLLTLKEDISKIMKWINILLVLVFGISSILYALICLYALPNEDGMDPLASAVFVVSGMLSFASIFLIGRFVKIVTKY